LNLLYTLGIYIANFHLKIIALFNTKIKLGVKGRAETFKVLDSKLSKTDKTIWFHCASLGEYEQGLPVFKEIKKDFPEHKIILTFFSPSGYEIRKNTPVANIVTYLPLDTKKNAKRFLDYLNPELTVFVKYDIWPNFLNELKRSYTRKALFAFEHIFTQNENSKQLLKSIRYNAVTVSGDTRFDRVASQLNIDNTLDFIEEFNFRFY